MLISGFISFRVLILPLLFLIVIPRAALSQSDFEHRYKQRSPSNHDLCFTNTSRCTTSFISKMSHCLERLEETQDEGKFRSCICVMYRNSNPQWKTCSECLRRNYKDQTLETWPKECKFTFYRPGNLSGGKLCKCNKCY